jgi:hypothetical protein
VLGCVTRDIVAGSGQRGENAGGVGCQQDIRLLGRPGAIVQARARTGQFVISPDGVSYDYNSYDDGAVFLLECAVNHSRILLSNSSGAALYEPV